MMRNFPRIVAAALGIFMVVFGAWAFVAPHSFYEQVAMFGTYNLHLIHDVGAFQVGLGVALLLALVWNDALSVVLVGGSAGAILHAVAHVMDRHLGASNTKFEPVEISLLALFVLAGTLVALRNRRAR